VRLNVDVAVVRVPTETVAPPLQFLVQLIQQQVTQQGGQRPTLWCPLVALHKRSVLQHSCFQEAPDDPQQAFVFHSTCETAHQYIVINPVEELLQVDIHDDLSPLGHVLLRPLQRLVGAAAGPESVAGLRKRGVNQRAQYLEDGLLDQPVHHRRDAQLPHPSPRFRDLDP
jgi:site-specific DNA recombinase